MDLINSLAYVNTANLNIYQNDLKLNSISTKNADNPLETLQAFELAFSDEWKDWEKAVLFTRGGFSISVSDKHWTENTAKIPDLILEKQGQLSVQVVGFKGQEFKKTNSLEIK